MNSKSDRYNISFEEQIIKALDKFPKSVTEDEHLRDIIASLVIGYEREVRSIISERNVYRERLKEAEDNLSKYKNNFDREIDSIKSDYQDAIIKLKQEKERYSESYQEKITRNANSFLDAVVESLCSREKRLNIYSVAWSFFGSLCLLLGIFLVCHFSKESIDNLNISWQSFFYYCIRGFGVVGIIGFLSRYSFIQSGNFMKASLRTDDRIHNIRFGQLYIVTYGASAEWKEVKEALSNWDGKTNQDWKQNIQFDEFLEVLRTVSSIYKNPESSEEQKDKK